MMKSLMASLTSAPCSASRGLVATAAHTGPIAKIGDTHQAVCEWSKATGTRLAGP